MSTSVAPPELPHGFVDGWDDVLDAQSHSRCPVNQCGRGARGKLMCSSHWRLVEHDARDALGDAARYYRQTEGFSHEMRMAAIYRWDAAIARCIHAAEVHPRG